MKFAWQAKYAEAMLELNREKLPRTVEAAENAIYQRLEELKQASARPAEELWAISDALRSLRVLVRTECSRDLPVKADAPQRDVAS